MEEVAYETSIFDEEPIQIVYAGFWARLGALMVDGVLLLPLSFIIKYNQTTFESLSLLIVVRLVSIAYKPLLEYLYGATPGKKALSIAVANLSYNKPNLKEALLRNIFGISIGLISVFYTAIAFASGSFLQSTKFPGSNFLHTELGYALSLGIVMLLIYIADIIVFSINKQNRSLHDLIGKTYVIKK